MPRQRFVASALILFLAAVAVACSSAAPAPVAEPAGVELAFAWRAGETIPFRMVNQIRQNITIEMDDAETSGVPAMPTMEMTIDQVMTGRQEVLEVGPDGTARVRLSYDTLRMDMVSPMISASWDSEEPGDDEMSSLFETSLRPMLETPMTLEITSGGKILSVEGIEAMAAAMITAGGGDSGMLDSLGGFDEASIEQLIQQSFFVLPTDPVAVGDSWGDRQEMPIPFVGGVLTGDLRFQLTSVDDGLARIDLDGDYEYQPGEEPNVLKEMMANLGDMDTEFAIDFGGFEGEILFDIAEGQYDTVRSALAMAVAMSMIPGAEAADDMPTLRMHMDLEMDATVEYGELAAE